MTKKDKKQEFKVHDPTGLADSNLERARKERDSARHELKSLDYAMSIHSSQTCMELALKSVYRYFGKSFTFDHRLKADEFAQILNLIPDDLKYHNFPRLFVLSSFWSQFYNLSKYGHESLGVGPEKIFKKQEAELALGHAEECYIAASGIRYWYHHSKK